MDLLLKGKIPEKGTVLDIGCGDGRNAIFFIRNGYDYIGIDTEFSKLKLLEHVSKSVSDRASFIHSDFRKAKLNENSFDLVICSRVMHFLEDEISLTGFWEKIAQVTKAKGTVYGSMDSIVDTTAYTSLEDKVQFPDGAVRYPLSSSLYEKMKIGFDELHPLITVSHQKYRTQSFFALQKN